MLLRLFHDDFLISNSKSTNSHYNNVFDVEKFSKLFKAIRVLAYVLRFLSNCSNPVECRQIHEFNSDELKNAFNNLIKLSQMEAFPIV